MHVQFVSKTFVSNRSEKFELHSMAIVSRNFKYIFSKFTGGTSRQRPKPKQLLNYMAGEPVPALAIGSNSFKYFQIVWYRIGRNWKQLRVFGRDLPVLAKKRGTGIQYSTGAYCAARATAQKLQICRFDSYA